MNKKIRTPLAAILLIIITVLNLLQFIDLFHVLIRFNILYNITIAIDLVLCIALFAKKFNNTIVIVLGCRTLMTLIQLVQSFHLFNILNFVAYALLTAFALAMCEQTLIKVDLSKVKEIGNKLFYLPAIVYLASNAYSIYRTVRIYLLMESYIIPIHTIVTTLLYSIVLLNLAMWLKDPYIKEIPLRTTENNNTIDEEQDEAYCELNKHILLLLFTFGIWNLIWVYRTTKYLNKTPNAEYYNPTNKLLLYMFVPFYSIYWFYKHGQRIDSFSKSKGINHSDMTTLCLILGIFVPIVAVILMQDKINALCTSKNINANFQEQPQTIDELKKFKELLDAGIITQEEFEAKKKQLLGL